MKIAMVTIYPSEEMTEAKMGGVAAYARVLTNTLASQGSSQDRTQVLVLAQKLDGDETETRNNGITIRRCWSPGPTYIFPLIREVRRAKPDLVHLQHELFLYGGIISALMFPVLLAILRIFGATLVVTIHGVSQPRDIDKEFIRIGDLIMPPIVVRWVLKVLFKLIAVLSHCQIVHHEFFRQTLIESYGARAERVVVIPLPILSDKPLAPMHKEEARESCGISHSLVVLFFGYVSKYKGIELMIDGFRLFLEEHPNSLLIIAGGKHPRLCEHPKYISYYDGLKAMATEALGDNVLWKGFVPESEIEQVLGAADLCVLPYVKALSCSGPAKIAMAMGLPIMMSEALAPLFPDDCRVFAPSPEALCQELSRFSAERERQTALDPMFMEEFLLQSVSEQTRGLYATMCRASL